MCIGKVPNASQSLFMNPNPGPESSFVFNSVKDVVDQASQEVIDACVGNQHCIYDAVLTNNIEIGLATMSIQQKITKETELSSMHVFHWQCILDPFLIFLGNFPPVFNGSVSFNLTANEESIYTFSVTDEDDFTVTVDAPQLINDYTLTDNNNGTWTFKCTWTHTDTRNFMITFMAKDSSNSTSMLIPSVIKLNSQIKN